MNTSTDYLKHAASTTLQEHILTSDNFRLAATCYLPLYPNNQVVLIGSATGVHQQYYRSFARFLSQNGYTVYTFDYRGVGKSGSEQVRYLQASMQDWGKYDIDALIKHIRKKHPSAKLLYIGHSIAGQILALTPESSQFSKVILVGSQHAYWRLWPLYARFVYAFLMYVVLPGMSHIFGYYPGKKLRIFWDLPKGVALEWASWCRHKKGVFGFHSDEQLNRIRVPLLAIGFSDDIIAPFRPMNALLKRYSHAAVTHWQYTPGELRVKRIGHFGFFRPTFKNLLWEPVLDWLEQTERIDKPLMGTLLSHQLGLYACVNE